MLRPEQAAEMFFGGFYENPNPVIAANALLHVFFTDDPALTAKTLPMLVRAARRDSEVVFAYRELAAALPRTEAFVARVLQAVDELELPDPNRLTIDTPADLDALWGEFLVTGDLPPVARIADVLTGEDRVLGQLHRWWSTPVRRLPGARRKRDDRARRLTEAGYTLDADAPYLGNQWDLDLLTWKLMSGGFQVRAELPFDVSDALLVHLSIKGAAAWSLQSNARQHPRVREVYASLERRDRIPAFVSGSAK